MKDYIYQRVLEVSNYIYETRATVRQAAKVFGVSKSTIHKDATERLQKIDKRLAEKVKKVLEYNKAERHIRGGQATKEKYLSEKNND
ncbi:sporulation transcriptional regulator SpoIIID [Acetohalobium arabaticum]|uniref:Sporulation transcriptional regulator SpoIIID n=1 Tax=Acetohalobium arabaticum (strain ATCC 49924 / DSM 5501 / Z-7288) TaxID=574087 RepID=D9QTX5_ACEAZ|nr:sporulation transcriptional regulator SpoIIID [Acetohalobium arabaticum]ADL13696.1 sporulation transcriptional regulator SpoIIID [Acetohalobium arabaticum DSM 5501]